MRIIEGENKQLTMYSSYIVAVCIITRSRGLGKLKLIRFPMTSHIPKFIQLAIVSMRMKVPHYFGALCCITIHKAANYLASFLYLQQKVVQSKQTSRWALETISYNLYIVATAIVYWNDGSFTESLKFPAEEQTVRHNYGIGHKCRY